jgi:methylenetetrahydrofolate reductase (NADPH)
VIERLKGANDQALEGRTLCTELVQEIRTIKGVHGVHLMAYRQEETVAEIIDRSGVLGGRVPWHPGRDPQSNSNRMAS